MSSDPTARSPRNTLLSLARLSCFVLGVLAALALVAYIPQSINGMYTDWQVLSSYPAVKALLPYQVYATTVWSLRYLAVTIFWLAAIFIYFEVGLRNSSFTWMGLFTALLLICHPPGAAYMAGWRTSGIPTSLGYDPLIYQPAYRCGGAGRLFDFLLYLSRRPLRAPLDALVFRAGRDCGIIIAYHFDA